MNGNYTVNHGTLSLKVDCKKLYEMLLVKLAANGESLNNSATLAVIFRNGGNVIRMGVKKNGTLYTTRYVTTNITAQYCAAVTKMACRYSMAEQKRPMCDNFRMVNIRLDMFLKFIGSSAENEHHAPPESEISDIKHDFVVILRAEKSAKEKEEKKKSTENTFRKMERFVETNGENKRFYISKKEVATLLRMNTQMQMEKTNGSSSSSSSSSSSLPNPSLLRSSSFSPIPSSLPNPSLPRSLSFSPIPLDATHAYSSSNLFSSDMTYQESLGLAGVPSQQLQQQQQQQLQYAQLLELHEIDSLHSSVPTPTMHNQQLPRSSSPMNNQPLSREVSPVPSLFSSMDNQPLVRSISPTNTSLPMSEHLVDRSPTTVQRRVQSPPTGGGSGIGRLLLGSPPRKIPRVGSIGTSSFSSSSSSSSFSFNGASNSASNETMVV